MKGYLLDTHIFLWLVMSPKKLSPPVRQKVQALHNTLYVSAATVWEIAQKRAAKKLHFDVSISAAVTRHSLTELPITAAHCEAAAELPKHHKDPFDRLLIAQAQMENLVLISQDSMVAAYDVVMLKA